MKIKKIIAIVLCVAALQTMMIGCNKKGGDMKSGKLTAMHQAVIDVYGDKYIPTLQYAGEQLKQVFNIEIGDCKEIIAESSGDKVYVDTFIGIEAQKDKLETIEKTLQEYKKKVESDAAEFPATLAKAKASVVLKVDKYVFFLMVGDSQKIDEQKTDEAKLKVAQEQVNLAVEAIKKTSKKK